MHLRPEQTRWFEIYVPRNETVYAVEALAATGTVELELDPRLSNPLQLEPVGRLIEQFQLLRARYAQWLPTAVGHTSAQVEPPDQTARKALECLKTWSPRLDALLEQQTRIAGEKQNLELLRECLTAMRKTSHDSAHLSQQAQFLYKGVFACPARKQLPANVCAVIDELVQGPEHNFFIVADEPGCQDIIEHAYHTEACLSLQVPEWLVPDPHDQDPQIKARLAELAVQAEKMRSAIEVHKHDQAVAAAVGDIDRLSWYLEHAPNLASTRKLCHITGWTTANDPQQLQRVCDHAGIQGSIRFSRPPEFSKTPVHLGEPRWVRPFVFIPEMLGTPDSTEFDSSNLLPVIVPLLFGYMFPDVGHGMMLTLFSAALYRHWPAGRFLIPCGISAILFGLVFGEVFGIEGVLDPLWVRPLDHPLDILLAPLLLGVALIGIGLTINGVQALWRGEARAWLLGDAAVLTMYGAVVLSLWVHGMLWLAVLALLWFVSGKLLGASSRRLENLANGLGQLLEIAFKLSLNTLSFLRVGAFALAHAGLSAAILGLTEGIDNKFLYILVLILGHTFIVAVEGLVVFVQTTRLVLFEFFTHFLRAEGRGFRPVSKPPHAADERKP